MMMMTMMTVLGLNCHHQMMNKNKKNIITTHTTMMMLITKMMTILIEPFFIIIMKMIKKMRKFTTRTQDVQGRVEEVLSLNLPLVLIKEPTRSHMTVIMASMCFVTLRSALEVR